MGQGIVYFLLVKLIFGLGGRALTLVLLFFVGCWVYIEWGEEATLWAVFGTIALWLVIRAILFALPTGIYPTFKDK